LIAPFRILEKQTVKPGIVYSPPEILRIAATAEERTFMTMWLTVCCAS
jgi:hypothetical protein